ncbi:uncharacterized protein BXIN_1280 [Babesia sp. Xinjiang]|uniref:uncharacterized protein n=1 Tax=Babesia sp. Xinjiang TaxID=462227 RepID=UPI000A222EB6|nr:uncharacterized protein BXIN_1280 [Babesia sp. Xinjiang]ORM39927.1 hypothetical protein BXIN_1280 [Babesia sp. Xinjiang]
MPRFHALIRRTFSSAKKTTQSNTVVADAAPISEKSAAFRRMVRDRLSLASYAELEDDFRRLSRSSKVVFAGVGSFLLVPGGFALLTIPSEVVDNLATQQFKLSSTALAWMSATTLAFQLLRFNRSVLGIGLTLIGLFGPTAALITMDHHETYGYAILMTSYALFGAGVTPYRIPSFWRSGKSKDTHERTRITPTRHKTAVLPVCLAKPLVWIVGLNLVMLMLTAVRRTNVRKELESTAPEDIIKRYEATYGKPN